MKFGEGGQGTLTDGTLRTLHFRDGTVSTITGPGNPQWPGWPSQSRIRFIQDHYYFDAGNSFGFGCGQIIDCRRDPPVPVLQPSQ